MGKGKTRRKITVRCPGCGRPRVLTVTSRWENWKAGKRRCGQCVRAAGGAMPGR